MRWPRRQRRDASAPTDLEQRLVWIWGSPRSGSSWLLEQLCDPLKPDVRVPAGFRVGPAHDGRSGPHLDAIPIDDPCIANHLAPAFGDPVELDGAYLPATLNNYLGQNPGYALATSHAASWQPGFRELGLLRLQSLVERAMSEGIPLSEAPMLVIKEVSGSHASDLVMSVFPCSRMLFLVRDGRDVVDSLLHAYAPGGFLARSQGLAIETPEQRAEGLRWACRLWACNVDVTLRAYDHHDPALRRIVRYEDLLASPIDTITPLFEWLGLERTGEWARTMVAAHSFDALPAAKRGPGEPQRAASPGLWRENLSAEEQATATKIIGPRLARLGYAD